MIPKVIYSYWHNQDYPDLVTVCIDSWKRHNPDHRIVVIDENTIHSYLDQNVISGADSVQRLTDYLRLALLAKHGGIWIDATIFMTASLAWVHEAGKGGKDLVAFYLDGFTSRSEYPVVESWFLASPPRSRTVMLWRNEFFKLLQYKTPRAYLRAYNGIDLQRIQCIEYPLIHVACQAIMQRHLGPQEVRRRIRVFKAEDGPYRYAVRTGWDNKKGIGYLRQHKQVFHQWRLVKMNGQFRRVLEASKLRAADVLLPRGVTATYRV